MTDGFAGTPVLSQRSTANATAADESETEITLGLLTAVEENESLTQRSAAQQLGIALGLTNAYLKRCIKKGLIKVNQVPPNRYAYYLTPQGFAEKSRLTTEYLTSSFTFFRRARLQCTEVLAKCAARRWRRIAIVGPSDLAEVAVLCAQEHDVELAGVVGAAAGETFLGLPVVAQLADLGPVDAVLITDLAQPQATHDSLRGLVPDERLLAPEMLRIRVAKPENGT